VGATGGGRSFDVSLDLSLPCRRSLLLVFVCVLEGKLGKQQQPTTIPHISFLLLFLIVISIILLLSSLRPLSL